MAIGCGALVAMMAASGLLSGAGSAIAADIAAGEKEAELDFAKSKITPPGTSFGGELGAEGSTLANARRPMLSFQNKNPSLDKSPEELLGLITKYRGY